MEMFSGLCVLLPLLMYTAYLLTYFAYINGWGCWGPQSEKSWRQGWWVMGLQPATRYRLPLFHRGAVGWGQSSRGSARKDLSFILMRASTVWPAYSVLTREGFRHKTINHQQDYVDPATGAHTQGIERTWLDAKISILKKKRGVPPYNLQSHLDQYCWRMKRGRMNRTCF